MFEPINISNVEELKQLVEKHEVDTSKWLKTVEKLYTEIVEEEQEIGLLNGELTIEVKFARVEIYSHCGKWVLEEDYMVRTKDRKVGGKYAGRRSVSEKLNRGEDH